jgi:hypothetical protein
MVCRKVRASAACLAEDQVPVVKVCLPMALALPMNSEDFGTSPLFCRP